MDHWLFRLSSNLWHNSEYVTTQAQPWLPQQQFMELSSLTVTPLPTSELEALKDLYQETNGPNWKWFNLGARWNFSTANPNPCSEGWEGVMCTCNMSSPRTSASQSHYTYYSYYYYDYDYTASSTACHIAKLYLIHHNLQGTIPDSIGDFPLLTHLHLDNNKLIGSLPSTLFTSSNTSNLNSKALQVLGLSSNRLSGTLPTTIGQCQNLTAIFLTGNRFQGSIPSQLASASKLISLFASNNNFSGSIPHSIYDISTLSNFTMANNLLTGTLSPKIRGWKNITLIDLSINFLSGTLPPQLFALSTLKVLSVGVNNFATGTIPEAIGDLINLEYLVLKACSLTGRVPYSLSHLSKLILLDLSNNPLNPWQFDWLLMSSFQDLEFLDLSSSSLTGIFSDQISNLQRLSVLELSDNYLMHKIPKGIYQLTNLQTLFLSNNKLTGTLSTEVRHLQHLTQLFLSFTHITGTLPTELGTLSNLQFLRLSNNSFTGTIPASIFSNTLKFVDISANSLTGIIPQSVAQLEYLEIISVSNNFLTGTIPPAIFHNSMLQIFDSSLNCLLLESISEAMCNATYMTILLISGLSAASSCHGRYLFSLPNYNPDSYTLSTVASNPITLPYCLLSLPRLSYLHASSNGLFGNIGLYLSKGGVLAPNLTSLILSHNYFTGTIPDAIQLRSSWQTLDLAFNEFTGTLNQKIELQPQAVLNLQVNRLSGTVPKGLYTLENIAILAGNYFDCGATVSSISQSSLPLHDPSTRQSVCGSNDVDLAMSIWACLLASVVMWYGMKYVMAYWNSTRSNGTHMTVDPSNSGNSVGVTSPMVLDIDSGLPLFRSTDERLKSVERGTMTRTGDRTTEMSILQQTCTSLDVTTPPLSSSFRFPHAKETFEETLKHLRYSCMLVLGMILLFMPIYVIVKKLGYNTLAHEYTYTVSALNISGAFPGIFMSAFYLFLIIICHYVVNSNLEKAIRTDQMIKELMERSYLLTTNRDITSWITAQLSSLKQAIRTIVVFFKLITLGLLNCVIVLAVNAAYIAAYLKGSNSSSVLIFLSFLLSLFKLGWSRFFVPSLISILSSRSGESLISSNDLYHHSRDLSFNAAIVVFNTVIIPTLAVLVVSPQCLMYVFTPLEPVSLSYMLPLCDEVVTSSPKMQNLTYTCYQTENVPQTLSFVPPFLYNYQCSYSVLVSYAAVYAYMFTISGLVSPAMALVRKLLLRSSQPGSTWHDHLIFVTPRHDLPVDEIGRRALMAALMKQNRKMLDTRDSRVNRSRLRETEVIPTHQAPQSVNPSATDLESSPPSTSNSDQSYNPDLSLDTNPDVTQTGNENNTIRDINTTLARIDLETESSMYIGQELVNCIFNSNEFILHIAQLFGVIMTFGVIFPPLAVLGMVAIVVQSLVLQNAIRTLSHELEARRLTHYLQILHDDCAVMPILLHRCLWVSFPCAYFVFVLFLFDIMGGSFPAQEGFAAVAPCLFLVGAGLTYLTWHYADQHSLR